jgi:hypothetical protein
VCRNGPLSTAAPLKRPEKVWQVAGAGVGVGVVAHTNDACGNVAVQLGVQDYVIASWQNMAAQH